MPCWKRSPFHCVRADGARATSRAGIKMFYCQLGAALLEGIWLVQSERPGCRWSFQKQLLSDWTRQMPSQRSAPVCAMTHDRPRQKRSQGFSVSADPEKWLWMLQTEPGSLASSSLCWRGNTSIATMSERKYMYISVTNIIRKEKIIFPLFNFMPKAKQKLLSTSVGKKVENSVGVDAKLFVFSMHVKRQIEE